MKENQNNSVFTTLLELLLAIASIVIALVGLLFTWLNKATWSNLFSKGKSTPQNFDKEKIIAYIKNNKKKVCIAVVIVSVLLIAVDNLLYEPVDLSYGKSDSSYNNNYGYSGYVSDRCEECFGTGDCTFCNGSGKVRNYGVTVECTSCDKWGNCGYCGGTGKK